MTHEFKITPDVQTINYEDLPFVGVVKINGRMHRYDHWCMPNGHFTYDEACKIGSAWADIYVAYLRSNTEEIGSGALGHTVKAMTFDNKSSNRGIEVGFFARLEEYIAAGVCTAKQGEMTWMPL
jgi:hypothetical protein